MGMLTTLSLGLLLGQAAPAPQSPVEKAIASFQADYAQRQKDKQPITAEWYYGNAEKYVQTLDFANMTTNDGFLLMDSPLMYGKSAPAKLATVAKRAKTGNNEEGWKGIVLKFRATMFEIEGTTITPKAVQDSMKSVLKHGQTKAMLAMPVGSAFVEGVYMASDSGYLSDDNVLQFGKAVSGGLPTASAMMLPEIYSGWAKKSMANDTHPAWKAYHDALSASLKIVAADDKRGKAMLERAVKQMESKIGRGYFLGQPAPEINMKWSSDPSIKKLSDLKGKVVILDFWATWCGPCIASMPKLRELADHYKGKPVVVLAVTSIQDGFWEGGKKTDLAGKPEEEIAMYPGYMERQKINWTVAVSEQEVFNPDYGVDGIPHMAIIDAQGKVRHSGLHPGALTLQKKMELIDPLIAEIK